MGFDVPGGLDYVRGEVSVEAPITFNVLPRVYKNKFLAADTTPSVLHVETWEGSGSVVNVTYFDNAQEGQPLKINGDGTTTVIHNVSKIRTNTGSNKLLTAGVVYRFTLFGGVWIEDAGIGGGGSSVGDHTHPADQITPGTFAGGAGGLFIFPGLLTVSTGPLVLGADPGGGTDILRMTSGAGTGVLLAHDNWIRSKNSGGSVSRLLGVANGTSTARLGGLDAAITQLDFVTGATVRWNVLSSGFFTPNLDITYDIGSASFRIKDFYANRAFLGAPVSHVGAKLVIGDTGASTANVEASAGGRIDWTFWDTSAALDERRVDTFSLNGVAGAGTLVLGITRTDAGVAGNQLIRAFRTGNTWTSLRLLDNGTGNVQIGNGVGGVFVTPDPGGTELFRIGGDVRLGHAGSVRVTWKSTDAAVDAKFWRWYSTNTGAFVLDAMNDAETVAGTALTINRSGTTITSVVVAGDPGGTELFRIGGRINVPNTASYDIAGAVILAVSGSYTTLLDPGANIVGLYIGNAGDPANYLNNTTHYVRSRDGLTNFTLTNSTEFRPGGAGSLTLGTSGFRWGKLWGTDADFSTRVSVVGPGYGLVNVNVTDNNAAYALHYPGVIAWQLGRRGGNLVVAYTSGAASDAMGTDVVAVSSSGVTFSVNATIAKTSPVYVLNDTFGATDPVTSAYMSFQRGGVEKGWVGFGDGAGGLMRLRNAIGDIRLSTAAGDAILDAAVAAWKPSVNGGLTLGTSALRWGKFWGQDADFSLDVKMDVMGTFDHTGTRFTSGAGPVADDIMSWHAGAGKWRPRFFQTQFTSGVVVAQNNLDSTFSNFAFSVVYNNITPAVPATPIVTPIYGGFIIDMGTVPPAGSSYVVDYSINGAAFSTDKIIFTSQKMVHTIINKNGTLPFLSTDNFSYKAKGRGRANGANDSAYSSASANANYVITTEVNAFGLVVASQISAVYLSAITANIGSVTAGQLISGDGKSILQLDSTFSIPGSVTQGIFFASANPVPAGITGMYIDFTATGANPLFHHAKIDLNADGTAIFKGLVDVTNAPLSTGFGGAFLVLRDSDVAHGMTGAVPTDVLGALLAGDALAGGLLLTGWADNTVSAIRAEGYNVGASSSVAVIQFVAGKKSGVSVGALAATDWAFDFRHVGAGIMKMFGDGLVVIDQQAGSSLEINQTLNPTTRRALGVFHGRVDSGATEAVLIDAEWNTAGAPTVLKMTVIDTTSAAGSLLVDLQVGGSSKFTIRKDGRTTVADALVFTAAVSKIIPGATSQSLRNNADSADNLLIADAGDATFRTFIEQNEMAAPASPGANKTRMYAKDKSGTSALYYKNDAGTEIPIGFTLIDTQTFTATGAGTWTKPAGAVLVRVVVIGGGGGGGGGRSGVAGAVRQGGGGGGGGATSIRTYNAVDLGATEALSVGVAGTGGNGGNGGADGVAGVIGGDSWFGSATQATAKQWAYGGGGGGQGSLATTRAGGAGGGWLSAGATGGTVEAAGGGPSIPGAGGQAFGGGNGLITAVAGQPSVYGGGSGGAAQPAGGVGGNGGVSQFGGGGGGAGGGVNTSNATAAPGTGGDNDVGLSGSVSGAGAAGDNFRAGQGGSGGTASSVGAGNNGFAGGVPGGGGGGGGAASASGQAGNGAAGGRGEVRVYSYA